MMSGDCCSKRYITTMRAFVLVTSLFTSPTPTVLVDSFFIKETSASISLRNGIEKNHDMSSAKHATSSACLRLQMSSTPFNYGQQQVARQNVRLPLLVDIRTSDSLRYDVPLPNAHLPPELTTASLYQLKLDVPLHRSVIQDAISSAQAPDSPIAKEGCCYGHVIQTAGNTVEDLVGVVGCAGEILIGAPSNTGDIPENLVRDADDSGPLFVLARGSYRFRVREIVKSIPYPIAVVDEILDDDLHEESGTTSGGEADGDVYDQLSAKDLIKQIYQSLDKILANEVEATSTPLSPLEKSILEDASSSAPLAQAEQRRFDAEERVAVFQTFVSSLLDIAPDEKDRVFAVGMMAGELANLSSDLREKMLVTVDGVERLRLVMRELSANLSMESARRITKSLSLGSGENIDIDAQSLKEAEDAQKQLQVGTPKLPPWADQIQKGIRVEYFWNEDEGILSLRFVVSIRQSAHILIFFFHHLCRPKEWCLGTVVEDPLKVMDEIVVTVKFDDDGSIHKLPLRGDDKARWRPPMGNTGAFD
ncbi:hypothetical protein ACHAWF_003546 [Thalassiosira exigua]